MHRAPLARHPPLRDRKRERRVEGRDGGVGMAQAELANHDPFHGLAGGDLEDGVAQLAGQAEGWLAGHGRFNDRPASVFLALARGHVLERPGDDPLYHRGRRATSAHEYKGRTCREDRLQVSMKPGWPTTLTLLSCIHVPSPQPNWVVFRPLGRILSCQVVS